MKTTYISILVLFMLGILLTGCGTKPGPVDTTVTVKIHLQTVSSPKADTVYLNTWESFYFYADTIQYKAPTLEDVLQKRLVSRTEGGSPLAATGAGEMVDTTRVRFNHLTETAVLVIYEPASKAYAWRQIELVDGLPNVSFSLFVRTWGTRTSYTENKWNVVLNRAGGEEPEETE